jgi:hypothetical protein
MYIRHVTKPKPKTKTIPRRIGPAGSFLFIHTSQCFFFLRFVVRHGIGIGEKERREDNRERAIANFVSSGNGMRNRIKGSSWGEQDK